MATGMLWTLAVAAGIAGAQAPTSIPSITFPPEDVGKRIHLWTDLVGRVPFVMGFQGRLIVFQHRARKISTFDIANPRQPKLISEVYGQGGQGDEHVVPTVGTRLLAAGSLMEYADPATPKSLGRAPIYMSVWPTLQWPYIYDTRTYDTDGGSSPLAIYDWSALGTPRLVKSMNAVSIVGFTTGTTVAIGNLLLVASGDIYAGVAVFDISNPVDPVLLGVNKQGPGMYTGQHYGKYIVTTGPKTLGKVAFFDISDPENIRLEWQEDIPNMSDYTHFQNGHFFGSRNGRWIKYDIAARKTVMTGVIPESPSGYPKPGRYAIPLGNMLFLGDADDGGPGVGDGRVGRAVGGLFVHQARPDSIGPTLLFNDPPEGALRLPVTSRIGLAFDESLDNRGLSAIKVRPAGGTPIEGTYGHTMGVVNFTPKEKLLVNTTYEVEIPVGAVKDNTGNPNAKPYTLRFSTGSTLASGLGGGKGRAGWWQRTRLTAGPLAGGAWRIQLAGYLGPLPRGRVRIEFSDANGRKGESLAVTPEDLLRGVEWKPTRLSGPVLMRVALPGGEVRGFAFAHRR